MGNAPADNGRGQLNPSGIFVTGEVFIKGGVNSVVIDIVIGAYLLVPLDINGVGRDVELDEGVLIEENTGSAGVGAEIGRKGGVFAAKY